MKHRLLGLTAALFFALSVTCAMHEDIWRSFVNPALEIGVKPALVAAFIDVRAAVALLGTVVTEATTYISGLAVRDRIAQWLLIAMVLAEALRAINDLGGHLRRTRAAAAWRRDTGHKEGRPRKDRIREWAAFATVCSIALVPVLYYLDHAA